MKASILAVGTELTTGQITNRNAVTISEKLKALGVTVTSHLTVPDDRALIREGLQYLENGADLIFVTGGLGPTSDDFTRDVVGEWAGLEPEFDENSWRQIQERLGSRGFTVHDMQKQQCYYPRGSLVLNNAEGTANAFKFDITRPTGPKRVYVLPGPPREIAAVWRDHLAGDLRELTRDLPRLITRSWDTLGLGESDVAFRVEQTLKDRPAHPPLEIGYRVHLPYCEVKLSFSAADAAFWQPWVNKVQHALEPVTVSRDFADVAADAAAIIRDLDFTFYDFVTGGFLHGRLAPFFKDMPGWSFKQGASAPAADLFDHEDNFMALLPFEEHRCVILCSIGGQRRQEKAEAPMKSPLMAERRRQYFAEMALIVLAFGQRSS